MSNQVMMYMLINTSAYIAKVSRGTYINKPK